MKTKVRIIIYLVLEAIIVACCVGPLAKYCIDTITNVITGKTSILEDNSFSRFTTLSNLFMAVVGMISVVCCVITLVEKKFSLPRWLVSIKYLATVYIIITFIIICMVLSWIDPKPERLWTGRELFSHAINPVLGVMSFCFMPNKNPVNKYLYWYALIPVVCYAILYGVMTIWVGTWKDFYSVTVELPWSAVIFAWAVLGFSLSVSWVLYKWKFPKTIAKNDKV